MSSEGGARLHGVNKYSTPGRPLVTIITATFNAASSLADTIHSIQEQTYPNIEWVVIDGASVDGTRALLRKNEKTIDFWISEPDGGIYDAWNKGIKYARGEYIFFLGADDCWSESGSVARMVAEIQKTDADLVCGKVAIIDKDGNKIRLMGGAWDKIKMERYQVVAHPGMLHNARLFFKYGVFDSSFKIIGDYEWLLRVNPSINALFCDYVVVTMRDGGVSTQGLLPVILEVYRAQVRYVPMPHFTRVWMLFLYVIRIQLSRLKKMFCFQV